MSKERGSVVAFEKGSDLRKYRTELPNIVDDMELDPYSFRLYVHLLRVAGYEGECWQSTLTMSRSCKMSTGKISQCKQILFERGLICVESGTRGTEETDTITIVNIWPENFAYFSKPKQEVIHHMNHSDSPHESLMPKSDSPHETKKEPLNTKNKPNEERDRVPNGTPSISSVKEKRGRKKQTAEADSPPGSDDPPLPTEWQKFVGAMCWICFGHDKVGDLTTAQRGALLAEAKKINEAGYSIEDLKKWYLDTWKQGWKWKKDESRPAPAEVRSSIPVLKSNAPQGFDGKGEEDGQATDSSGWSPEEIEHGKKLKREGRHDEFNEFVRAANARLKASLREV